uniref:Formin homology 2 domain containing 1 n=1 Tax=Scleropages formosus TaxID=113540 RepID=A0A8C9V9F3_SCLFO
PDSHLTCGTGPPMVVLTCRVQYLDDSDPFAYENFPQPRKPLPYELDENVALSEQIAGVHRLLEPPLKLEDCTLQRTASGSYLDVELSLAEQRDDLEQLYEDIANGKKPILILRTQLSVRVHSILEKLYNSHGPELRRSLFSLKQLFEDDKDLVPEFVNSEGLACFIKVGAEADHNYQNYILRALSQIMLFVDGMNGVINHNETVQWLYTLTGSLSRLVVKMALKLLIVFVEYTQSNALLLIQAVNTVDDKRGVGSWSYLIEILEERNLSDCELLIYTMSLINKTLAALPDQDSFYDVTDCLEEQGMESIMEKHMNNKETESELKQQFAIYENALKYEDGEVEEALPNIRKERRKVAQCAEEGRRSRRSVGQSPTEMLTLASSIFSPAFQSPNRSLDEMASPQVSEPSTPESAKAMPSISESGSQGSSPLLPHVSSNGTALSPAESENSTPAWKRLGNKQKQWLRPQCSIDAEMHSSNLEKTLMMPLSRDSQHTVDGLQPSSIILKIKDLDFSDLQEEEDIDVLDIDSFDSDMSPPPPMAGLGTPPPPPLPPPFGSPLNPPPPPPPPSPHGISPLSPTMSQDSALIKKKKTVKLFWKELKQSDSPSKSTFGHGTIWASLDKVAVDTAKLEHLFESKAKEIPLGRKGSEGKKPEIHILDPKRSNAINIGMTVLPPIHVIKSAIMNFDEFAINKEGIEKILTMVPTEEEKQKIQEAQLVNPDIPLGKAEQFLLTLSSISALNARLQLWSFKLNYDVLEKEIAEPLFDLKLGMTQLASNATFQRILATLLAVGNFLNNSNAKGFDLSYLEKVTEVKDTVHRQSLLHHICSFVVENYPDSSDVYSEIPAITRSAKIDFEQLSDNLIQLERKCKTSWNNLKVMAKHETKVLLRNRMTDFLKDCTERIIILKVVHRRIINRFHSFLLYLGQPSYSVRETKVTHFCKIIGEFSLEYRTTRERVLTHKRKREAFRERTKTRGKLITETEKFSNAVASEAHDSLQPASTSPEPRLAQEEHENMKNMLIASMNPSAPRHSRSIRSKRPFCLGSTMASSMSTFKEDSSSDATDEIMDLLVKSVTQTPAERPSSPKTRKRSRVNRKSLRRTLKNGLSSEEMVQALSFSKQSEQV